MYCKKCGTKQKEGQKFCPKCGTPFPVIEKPKSVARSVVPPMKQEQVAKSVEPQVVPPVEQEQVQTQPLENNQTASAHS